jgi:hypothetical protein
MKKIFIEILLLFLGLVFTMFLSVCFEQQFSILVYICGGFFFGINEMIMEVLRKNDKGISL